MAGTEQKKVLLIDTGTSNKSVKELRDRLKELRDVLVSTEKGTDDWNKAMQEAANIQHELRETTKELNSNAMDFGQIMSNATKSVNGMIGAIQSAQAVMSLMGLESEETAEAIKKMQASMALIQGLSAFEEGIKAVNRLLPRLLLNTKAQTIAQKALNAVMQPKVLIAITAAITALVFAYNKLTKASREAAEAQKEQQKEMQSISKSGNDLVASFRALQHSYKQLQTVAEKNKWIKDHEKDWKNLGIAVKDANAADEIFVRQSEAVVAALKARAQATAAYSLYTKKLEDAQQQIADLREEEKKTLEEFAVGTEIGQNDVKRFGLRSGVDYASSFIMVGQSKVEYRKLKAQGIERIKQFYKEAEDAAIDGVDEVYGAIFDEAEKKAQEAENAVAGLLGGSSSGSDKQISNFKKQWDKYKKIITTDVDGGDLEVQIKAIDDFLNSITSKEKQENAKLIADIEERRYKAVMRFGDWVASGGNKLQNAVDVSLLPEDEVEEEKELMTLFARYRELMESLKQSSDFILQTHQDALSLLNEMYDNDLISYETYIERKKQIDKEYTQFISANTSRQIDLYATMASNIGSSLTSIANLYAEVNEANGAQTKETLERQKGLQIAGVVVSTLGGIAAMTNSVWSSPDTGEFWAKLALQIAMTTEMIATMGVQIAQIKKQTIGNAGGLANLNTSALSSLNAPISYTRDVNGAEIGGNIKDTRVYVVESDITNAQKKVSVQQSENRY